MKTAKEMRELADKVGNAYSARQLTDALMMIESIIECRARKGEYYAEVPIYSEDKLWVFKDNLSPVINELEKVGYNVMVVPSNDTGMYSDPTTLLIHFSKRD